MSIKLLLLFLHLICAAGWLGCILVEAVFEHSAGADNGMRRHIARLHWITDLYIEIPLFIGVLLTGGAMISISALTPILLIKIGCGLLAILANIGCVLIVRRRLSAADSNNWQRYAQLDLWQHRIGALVLLGSIGALGIGGYLFSQGIF